MKIISGIKTLIIIASLFFAGNAFGQEYSKLASEKSISFDNESESTKVEIGVEEKYSYLQFQIHCRLQAGAVKILLLNPKGVEKGEIAVKAENDNISKGKNTTVLEVVSGEMEKVFRDPLAGDWIVKVMPANAVGEIRIQSVRIYNPKSDLLETEQIGNSGGSGKSE
jgi:hypothetical protein